MSIKYDRAADVPHEWKQALYGHELLRRLGFTADEIFVGIQDGRAYVLVRRGGRHYGFIVAATAKTDDELAAEWPAAVEIWNATCSTDPGWEFEASDVRRAAVPIITDLGAAGLTPRAPN